MNKKNTLDERDGYRDMLGLPTGAVAPAARWAVNVSPSTLLSVEAETVAADA